MLNKCVKITVAVFFKYPAQNKKKHNAANMNGTEGRLRISCNVERKCIVAISAVDVWLKIG